MACPFFEPVHRSPRPVSFRLPLGAFWLGWCGSPLASAGPVDEEHQLELCNLGYARGRCPAFPDSAEADAVRFARRPTGPVFILEKEHVPVRFGPLEQIEPGSRLDRQRHVWNTT